MISGVVTLVYKVFKSSSYISVIVRFSSPKHEIFVLVIR